MSKCNYYVGELQDSDGNVVYPHTEASVVFCSDGESVQKKLASKSIEALSKIIGVTDSTEVSNQNILATSKALNNLKTELNIDLNKISLGNLKQLRTTFNVTNRYVDFMFQETDTHTMLFRIWLDKPQLTMYEMTDGATYNNLWDKTLT